MYQQTKMPTSPAASTKALTTRSRRRHGLTGSATSRTRSFERATGIRSEPAGSSIRCAVVVIRSALAVGRVRDGDRRRGQAGQLAEAHADQTQLAPLVTQIGRHPQHGTN